MDWMEILQQIFELCVIPLLGILTTLLVKTINEKSKEIAQESQNELAEKYITMLAQTISDCVIATNQTYVSSLKNQDAFTIDAQKEAFSRTYNAVMAILSDEAKTYLANIYGDLEQYITTKIEAEVNYNKQ